MVKTGEAASIRLGRLVRIPRAALASLIEKGGPLLAGVDEKRPARLSRAGFVRGTASERPGNHNPVLAFRQQ
jgi:hypothetical protein